MARHRWATGERTSGPDRLERVLNLNAAPPREPGTEAAWPESTDEEDAPGLITDAVADSRSGRRWAATRRAALVAAGCALAVGGWQFVGAERGSTEIVPVGPSAPGATDVARDAESSDESAGPGQEEGAPPEQGTGSGDARDGTVLVHIAGAVQSPGVVEAPVGARVFEVLEKAGGALPEAELSAVNLAATVQDGQQILIPRVGDAATSGPAPSPGSGPGDAPVNLNTAAADELEQLPRVGPVLAGRIVEWRDHHGPFASPADLDAVPGIGPAMLESLLPLVTV